MRFPNCAMVISFSLLVYVLPAQAQYQEMSKVNALSKQMPEPEMYAGMAAHFNVPVDSLKQEMAANDSLSFGTLYLAHAIAKATKSDVKSLIADSKTKPWPTIAKEKNVDMKALSQDAEALGKEIKGLKGKT